MPETAPAQSPLRLASSPSGLICACPALGEGGLGNPFYAATVRSMTKSLHNFFFVSFDPFGAFMADKPPFALWLQSASALTFGYGGFALVLPQAVAGIAAVLLLYVLGRRLLGDFGGLVAACTLAVLPASVLVSRNNTMDTLVMALSLGSALLVAVAASSRRLLPLAAAGLLAGLAFNTKGFEAFVAQPGILAYFWLASKLPLRARLTHLAIFGAVLAAVGVSWVTAVSLFPASERPLVLNSNGNSIWDLTFAYNGLDRVLGGDGFNPAAALTTATPNVIPLGVLYGGERGPFRVLGEFPGPLIAVALPAALAGALLFAVDLRDREKRASSALWLLWLAAGLVVFSASRLGSPHYLEVFSPAIAACLGMAAREAVAGAWWRRAIALAGAAGSAAYVADRLTQLGDAGRIIEWLAIAGLAAAAATALGTFVPANRLPRAAAFAPFAALVAILFTMSYQAIRDAPIEGVQPGLVILSEDRSRDVRYDPALTAYSFITGRYDYLRAPLSYLEARRQPGQYLVAVRSFYLAAAVISQRDAPVLPMYSEFRNRPELPVEALTAAFDQRKLEYVMLSLPLQRSIDSASAAVIQARCTEDVSRAAGLAPQTGLQLLHCR